MFLKTYGKDNEKAKEYDVDWRTAVNFRNGKVGNMLKQFFYVRYNVRDYIEKGINLE